jgi:hypothetical protein
MRHKLPCFFHLPLRIATYLQIAAFEPNLKRDTWGAAHMSSPTRRFGDVTWTIRQAVQQGYYGCAWNPRTGQELHVTPALPSVCEVRAQLKAELCRLLNVPRNVPIESVDGARL